MLCWDNDLVRMCWRRHLLQGIWLCWGHWLKCGGVGVVLGQLYGEDVLEETFVTGNNAVLGAFT